MGSAGASGESCYVCGGFKSVAQAHHVIPLNEQFDRGFETPNHDHERLCPTQHVVLHLWIDDDISDHEGRRRAGPTIGDLSDAEFGGHVELAGRRGE